MGLESVIAFFSLSMHLKAQSFYIQKLTLLTVIYSAITETLLYFAYPD